jgi:ribosomal protein L14
MFLETVFSVADNSGVLYAKCIGVVGQKTIFLTPGRILIVMPEKIDFSKKLKKKKYWGVITSLRRQHRRFTGISLRGFSNSILLLDGYKFLGTRVYGPICKEMRQGDGKIYFKKIISYSGKTL